MRDYFQIFTDTLIAHLLPPFQKTAKRKAVATEKFYFFDLGVARNLAKKGLIAPGTPDFGLALEHLILIELLAWRDYSFSDAEITYWRSQSQLEVDFVINDAVAIEVKASGRVAPQDLRGMKALSEEITLKRKIVVSGEASARTVDGIEILPYEQFFRELWGGKAFSPLTFR